MQSLHSLSKDCGFVAVSAEEHRRESVRDAFINGLLSSAIRQRLLENRELDLDAAYAQANSLDLAQQHSLAYEHFKNSQVMALSSNVEVKATSTDENEVTAALSSANKKCFFCGSKACHPRKNCPARNAICYKCQKKGHFSKCCKSKRPLTASITTFSSSKPQLCAITPAPTCLSYATITSSVCGHKLSTIVDSGSSLSYINDRTARFFGLYVEPYEEIISLASSEQKGNVLGHCEVDLSIHEKTYPSVKFRVLKDLCADVLLGGDFQRQRKCVIFQFDGDKSDCSNSKASKRSYRFRYSSCISF